MDAETWHEVMLVLAGGIVSLIASALTWLIPYLIQKSKAVEYQVRVLECSGTKLKLALQCKNKSKQVRFVENVKVYFDEGSKRLIQCENQIDDYRELRIEHNTKSDSLFSFEVPAETIKKVVLEFESTEEIKKDKQYSLWINNKTYLYDFDINNHNWQKIRQKRR